MIVSASRRTDLPAHYMPWLMRRLEDGFCIAVNPFNPLQTSRVSLDPQDVDALVFWTRAPASLAAAWPRIQAAGHQRAVALVTITGYGAPLEPGLPEGPRPTAGFHRLAEAWGGPERLAWRYDPILLGPGDTPADHRKRFESLARDLEGSTGRVIVSFLDMYRKTARRLREIGYPVDAAHPGRGAVERQLLADLADLARVRGMALQTCAEPADKLPPGVSPGRCVDPDWLEGLFPGRPFLRTKDPGQRETCGCAPSRDIGIPDTCPSACVYCYAVRSAELARGRHSRHDPECVSLLPG